MMDKKFREEFKIALKMINFAKQKQLPVKAPASTYTEPFWGWNPEESENE